VVSFSHTFFLSGIFHKFVKIAFLKNHINIIISGGVQRVGFRFAAMQEAYKQGVFGFVMNMNDGTVFIEAEGEQKQLDLFLAWCHKGPQGAIVKNVIVNKGAVVNYSEFIIKHRQP